MELWYLYIVGLIIDSACIHNWCLVTRAKMSVSLYIIV